MDMTKLRIYIKMSVDINDKHHIFSIYKNTKNFHTSINPY